MQKAKQKLQNSNNLLYAVYFYCLKITSNGLIGVITLLVCRNIFVLYVEHTINQCDMENFEPDGSYPRTTILIKVEYYV